MSQSTSKIAMIVCGVAAFAAGAAWLVLDDEVNLGARGVPDIGDRSNAAVEEPPHADVSPPPILSTPFEEPAPTVVPQPTLRVEGRVVESITAADGALKDAPPILKVAVKLRSFDANRRGADPRVEGATTTDADGAFAFMIVPPAGARSFNVEIEDAIWSGISEAFVAGPGDAAPAALVLSARRYDAVIEGVVRSPSGAPVAGAWVGSDHRVITNASGAYRLPIFIDRGGVLVGAGAPGFAPARRSSSRRSAANPSPSIWSFRPAASCPAS